MPPWRALWLGGALLGCVGGSAQPAQPTAASEGFVTGADDVRLFYRMIRTQGDTLLFLHRWEVGQGWADLGKAVHVWSWRGCRKPFADGVSIGAY
jgi:hypothetical protein